MISDTEATRAYATNILNAFGQKSPTGDTTYEDAQVRISLAAEDTLRVSSVALGRVVVEWPGGGAAVLLMATIPVPVRRYLNELAGITRTPDAATMSLMASHLLAGLRVPLTDELIDGALDDAKRIAMRGRLAAWRASPEMPPPK